jgi:hypothetical protein
MLAVLVRALAVSVLLAAAAVAAPPSRVVAIGDVHGGYEPFLRVLVASGVTDAEGHWAAGDATFVQLGDAIDRGPDDRRVLDLLMALEKEAKQAGGRAIALLGNHEIMNLHRDLRYVSHESLAGFGGAKEHAAAFSPKGTYGRWLRKNPALVKIDDVVFVHGGIAPEVATLQLKGIAERVPQELKRVDAARARAIEEGLLPEDASYDALLGAKLPALAHLQGWLVANPSGPFWFRGYAEWSDADLAARIPDVLRNLGARHVVVGHTPQLPAAIRVRAGGRVFLIDGGMLDGAFYPGGAPLALEIAGGRFHAVDASGARALLHEGPPTPLPAPAP